MKENVVKYEKVILLHTYNCWFCGKSNNQVEILIQGPMNIHICNECVDICIDVLKKHEEGNE